MVGMENVLWEKIYVLKVLSLAGGFIKGWLDCEGANFISGLY